jgi:RNA polymerase sigma factor for flagellar operon FliA
MSLTGPAAPSQGVAEERLIRDYLPLVHYAVAEISSKVPRHVARDDLVSAGMVGLAQAARSYDPRRGVAFPRFAASRIRGAMLDELRSRDWASRSVRAKARRLAATTERLTARLGRSPTPLEVAGALGISGEELGTMTDDIHRAVVLNLDGLPLPGAPDDVLAGHGTAPEDLLVERERASYLVTAVAQLPERLRRVVVGYFFENLPMQVLADELGVTQSRISQMRGEALALLKDAITTHFEPESTVATRLSPQAAKRRAAFHEAIATATSAARSNVGLPAVAGPMLSTPRRVASTA